MQRTVALELSARAAFVNKLVSLLTLAGVFGALSTGTFAFFGQDAVKPYWAMLNVVSVVLAVWAAMMSYAQWEFEYHELASRFQALGLRIENFTYAARGSSMVAEDIDLQAARFHGEYSDIMDRTRQEYKQFSDRNEQRIAEAVGRQLEAEGWSKRETTT